MAKITAPNKEFTGKRGQVGFVDGEAETDDPTMLAYFRRHGYKVEGAAKSAKKGAAKKSAAKPQQGDSEGGPASGPAAPDGEAGGSEPSEK